MAKKKQEEEQKESVIAVIKELAKERGIDEEVLMKAIEDGIVAAFRREFSSSKNIDNVFAEINRETGEIVKFPSSTSRMSTVEFSAYCEKLREYAREYLNVEIPDPDKYWRLREDEDHS